MLEKNNAAAALLFPGQGAQYIGMGKELYDELPRARAILDEACDRLNFDIRELIFSGSEEALRKTDMAQLSIFLVSLMYLEKWKANNPEQKILAVAGHSLGEYTALCASNMAPFEKVLEIVSLRGKYMRECCSADQGMLAVLGLEEPELTLLLKDSKLDRALSVSNINSKTQIVLAGMKSELQKLRAYIAEEKLDAGIRSVFLNVEGAFHSPFMEDANRKLLPYLDTLEYKDPDCWLVSNFNGKASRNGAEIIGKIKNQMVSTVRWYDTILQIKELGAKALYEVGPGNTLKNICMTITFNPKCHGV